MMFSFILVLLHSFNLFIIQTRMGASVSWFFVMNTLENRLMQVIFYQVKTH